MRRIIAWSLQARVFIVAIVVGLMFLGATEARDTSVDTLPEFAPPTVEIQTEALGLSANEVEQLITVPLEADLLAGVAWLDVIRSESVPGLSKIELIFQPGTDIMRARQMVQERMTQAHALPNVSKPPVMIQPKSSSSRVMIVGLSSQDHSLIEMSVLARWTIKPKLLGVPGVANVSVWGNRERQLQVLADPERMKANGITLDEVIATTGNSLWVSPLSFLEASTPGTGGFVESPNQRLGVQHIQPLSTPEELAQVPLEDHPILRLSDVATLAEDHQPLIGDAVLDNGQGLLLVIEKFPDANTLEVTREVDTALDELRPGLAGVQIDSSIYRPATAIDRGLDDLAIATIVGLVLAVLVLAAFFFGWRAALISGIAIPASLMGAGLVLMFTGNTFNVLVLAGLVIGAAVVVDDAVISMENVVRRLRQRASEGIRQSFSDTVLEASMEMRGSAIFALAITLLTVLPVMFLDGPSGKFFPPLATAYALAVVAAMAASLTLTPALSLLLLTTAPMPTEEPPLAAGLKSGYGKALGRVLETPGVPYLALAVIAVIGIAAATQLDQKSLLPSFEERDMLIQWDGAPGTSQTEMSRIIGAAGQELKSIPGVRKVGAHVGRAESGDQTVGVNSGELWVSIDSAADYGATRSRIEEVVDGYPGLSHDVATYTEDRVRHIFEGTDNDVTVRVYGENMDVLRAKASEVQQAASEIDGVGSAVVDLPIEEPTVEIEVNLEAAQRYGVRPGDVRRTAATLVSGTLVGSLFEEQKVFEVVVRGTSDTRANLTSIRELPIATPTGTVQLQEVADVRIAPNQSIIKRQGVSRYIDVAVHVEGRSVGAVKSDVEARVDAIQFPLEHHAELIGAHDGRDSVQNLGLPLAVTAGILIFLLLHLAFNSWRLAAVFFASLPAALAGGAVTAVMDGGDLTIASYAGFMVLLAIAARNCMALVNHYQMLQEQGDLLSHQLILRGAQERVSPVLMTALAVGFGFAPLAVLGDVFGGEVLTPMIVVVLGGLVTSTAYNLFIAPALYARFAVEVETETARSDLSISHGEVPAA